MSNQLVQCPYDPNHRVIAQRLPYHELKCRRNFRGRAACIENSQTYAYSLKDERERKDEQRGVRVNEMEANDENESELITLSPNKWPSSVSEAGQSYGGQSISSASLCSFSKDSLRWEKKKIERNRFKRGLEITPRRSSPEYELFSALTEAIDEKMKKNDFPAEDNCQSLPQARPSFGRGMPSKIVVNTSASPRRTANSRSSTSESFWNSNSTSEKTTLSPGITSETPQNTLESHEKTRTSPEKKTSARMMSPGNTATRNTFECIEKSNPAFQDSLSPISNSVAEKVDEDRTTALEALKLMQSMSISKR